MNVQNEQLCYDLSKERWIPVVKMNGDREELGMRDTLVRAHEIRELYSNSPVETITINRLLLAVSLHIFSETAERKGWKQIFRSGRFDEATIQKYFDERPEKFDLLHPERPFYQHPLPKENKASAINRLIFEEATGNNATLFDHNFDRRRKSIPLTQAARGVIAMQSFGLSGTAGGGKDNFSQATLVSGAVFWIRGNSLFEALLYNAPPTAKGRMESADNLGIPVWEAQNISATKRAAKGYLDYLTWQPRRLHFAIINESGQWYANGLKILQGDKIEPVPTNDPMMSYITSTTIKKGISETKIQPYKFKPETALWRDVRIFLQPLQTEHCSTPRIIECLQDWQSENDTIPQDIDVFGVLNDKAKVEFWRHERLPIYPKIISDIDRYGVLEEASQSMEQQAQKLQNAVKEFAAIYLYDAHFEKKKEYHKSDKVVDTNQKAEAAKLAQSIAVEHLYWSHLEVPFFELLRQIGTSDDMLERDEIEEDWQQKIQNIAEQAYQESLSSFAQTVRGYRAFAAGKHLFRQLTAKNKTNKRK